MSDIILNSNNGESKTSFLNADLKPQRNLPVYSGSQWIFCLWSDLLLNNESVVAGYYQI